MFNSVVVGYEVFGGCDCCWIVCCWLGANCLGLGFCLYYGGCLPDCMLFAGWIIALYAGGVVCLIRLRWVVNSVGGVLVVY